jgi:hypothetical protein
MEWEAPERGGAEALPTPIQFSVLMMAPFCWCRVLITSHLIGDPAAFVNPANFHAFVTDSLRGALIPTAGLLIDLRRALHLQSLVGPLLVKLPLHIFDS